LQVASPDTGRVPSDGRPRSWHIDVEEDKLDAELKFLRKEIYQQEIGIGCREITALERFSSRD
jgi:DNA polymerase-3 subunit epsilon